MSGWTQTIVIGNLGNDPEVRSLQSGGKVCTLSVATSETWKDKNSGERQERVEWHRIVIWSEPLVEIADKYLRKGSRVQVVGKNETRKWTDQNGVERYTTEIVLRPYNGQLLLLGDPQGGRDDRERRDDRREARGYDRRDDRSSRRDDRRDDRRSDRRDDRRGGWDNSDLDDEIPF